MLTNLVLVTCGLLLRLHPGHTFFFHLLLGYIYIVFKTCLCWYLYCLNKGLLTEFCCLWNNDNKHLLYSILTCMLPESQNPGLKRHEITCCCSLKKGALLDSVLYLHEVRVIIRDKSKRHMQRCPDLNSPERWTPKNTESNKSHNTTQQHFQCINTVNFFTLESFPSATEDIKHMYFQGEQFSSRRLNWTSCVKST